MRLAHPDDTSDLVELVRSGDSEIGITELPIGAAQLVSRQLGRQELVAIAPPGSRRRAPAGVGVVPRPMPTVAQREGAVISPLEPALWRQLGLIHRPATLSPAARAFIDIAIGATDSVRTGRGDACGRPDR